MAAKTGRQHFALFCLAFLVLAGCQPAMATPPASPSLPPTIDPTPTTLLPNTPPQVTVTALDSPVAAPINPTNQPNPGPPYHPFPQHVKYAPGSLLPDALSQAEGDQIVSQFYAAWKERYIRQGCGEGRYYLHTNSATNGGEDTISISEGHGYGMLVTALMAGYDPDAQQIFDGMVRFYQDHPSVSNPALMAWNQVAGCQDVEPGNTGTATDGDLDIAYALLLADRQWGSQGQINYRRLAQQMLRAILTHEINLQTHTTLLGDWAQPGEAGYYFSTRSSDFMPAHFRSFAKAAEAGATAWDQVLEAGYALFAQIQQSYSPVGLVPDFIVALHHNPRPAPPNFLEAETDGWYAYNACRVPWRIGVDYLLHGEPRARAFLQRLNQGIYNLTNGDPYAIYSGYRLDGTSDEEHAYLDLAFVAPLGVGAMAGLGEGREEEAQAWVNALWEVLSTTPFEEGGYYDHALTMMALLVMSGNWWGP